MNKQELIEKYKDKYPILAMDLRSYGIFQELWKDIKNLDEPQKVKVPQFVADWYEKNKDDFETNVFLCIHGIVEAYEDEEMNDFENWVINEKTKPFQTLVNMHQFGYEVEEEKKYIVKLKNTKAVFCYLSYFPDEDFWGLGSTGMKDIKTKHTRKELEDSGFGEVFNSPLFEVEEVE